MWTEILAPLEQGQPAIVITLIEAFFTLFYLTFSLLQKAFVVLLMCKFIHRVGDSGSILPGEQLNHFRNLWRRQRKGKNQNSMKFDKLLIFLANLKV